MITSPILPLFRSKWLIQTTIFELCQVLSASAIAARSWLKCNPWGNIRPLKELWGLKQQQAATPTLQEDAYYRLWGLRQQQVCYIHGVRQAIASPRSECSVLQVLSWSSLPHAFLSEASSKTNTMTPSYCLCHHHPPLATWRLLFYLWLKIRLIQTYASSTNYTVNIDIYTVQLTLVLSCKVKGVYSVQRFNCYFSDYLILYI